MTLAAVDERLHTPPDPTPPSWQENMFFICWDADRTTGLLCHVQRVPALAIQEVRAIVAIGGALASATIEAPFDAAALVPEFDATPLEPFRAWRLQLDAKGSTGRGPLGFLATRNGEDTAFGFDVTLESSLPVVDFAEGLAAVVAGLRTSVSSSQMGDQEHYEQGGTWHGRLRIGSEEVDASGLFVRDHSWGTRSEHGGFRAFWTAACLDGGRLFCNAIGIPTGGRALGIGAVADLEGVTFTSHVAAYFGPSPGICTYERTAVSYGPPLNRTLAADTQLHAPIELPYSGPRRYDNNALSAVRMGNATGFGVMEWAAVLSPGEAAVIQGGETS